jgi:hypothetical protein
MSVARLLVVALLLPSVAAAQPGSDTEKKRKEIERQLRIPKNPLPPPGAPTRARRAHPRARGPRPARTGRAAADGLRPRDPRPADGGCRNCHQAAGPAGRSRLIFTGSARADYDAAPRLHRQQSPPRQPPRHQGRRHHARRRPGGARRQPRSKEIDHLDRRRWSLRRGISSPAAAAGEAGRGSPSQADRRRADPATPPTTAAPRRHPRPRGARAATRARASSDARRPRLRHHGPAGAHRLLPRLPQPAGDGRRQPPVPHRRPR